MPDEKIIWCFEDKRELPAGYSKDAYEWSICPICKETVFISSYRTFTIGKAENIKCVNNHVVFRYFPCAIRIREVSFQEREDQSCLTQPSCPSENFT